MPFTEIGKAAQSAIYRAGTFGRRPEVPTDGAALEAAARRAMSRRGFAYVAGSAGGEATARANRDAFDRWRVVPRMLVDTSERDLGVELFGRRHASPLLVAPIGVLSTAHADADLAVARAAREQQVTADPQHPGVGADGAGRRRARRLRPLVPALLEQRRRPGREPGPARRGVRERGDRRHPRHGIPRLAHRATSTSGTCRSRAARASRSTPPTRCSAGSSPSGWPPRQRPSPSRSPGPPRRRCARWSR